MGIQKAGRILIASALLAAAGPGHAGLYADDMARCLVSSTSPKDKTDLVRWIFATAALHPDVANIATLTAEQRETINRTNGALLQRLLTVDCRKQAGDAFKFEGAVAFQLSFQVLGQVAMRELMTNPVVSKGFADISKYVDESKLREIAPADAEPKASTP